LKNAGWNTSLVSPQLRETGDIFYEAKEDDVKKQNYDA
jgi:hypothetical protein